MGDVKIVPIGHVERAVGPDAAVDRPEAGILGKNEVAGKLGFKSRAARLHASPAHGALADLRVDGGAVEIRGKFPPLIERKAAGQTIAQIARMFHGGEEAIGIRIVQRAVFAPALDVIAPLHVVAEGFERVAAGEQVAVAIQVDAPGVAAPLGKQLEAFGRRVIAPDALLKLDAADVGRHGASLRAIEPAVGPPRQRVGHRVGIVHAEAREEDFGITVGDVVVIAIGIEEQVGDLNHVDAVVADLDAGTEIQVAQEVLDTVGPAVRRWYLRRW